MSLEPTMRILKLHCNGDNIVAVVDNAAGADPQLWIYTSSNTTTTTNYSNNIDSNNNNNNNNTINHATDAPDAADIAVGRAHILVDDCDGIKVAAAALMGTQDRRVFC